MTWAASGGGVGAGRLWECCCEVANGLVNPSNIWAKGMYCTYIHLTIYLIYVTWLIEPQAFRPLQGEPKTRRGRPTSPPRVPSSERAFVRSF